MNGAMRKIHVEKQLRQSQEPWEERAIKFQLLYPGAFSIALALRLGDHSAREFTMRQFRIWGNTGVIHVLNFGEVTYYRVGLFLNACRSFNRQCERERNRGQIAATKGEAAAQKYSARVGLSSEQVAADR